MNNGEVMSSVVVIVGFVFSLLISLAIGYVTGRYAQKKGREKGVWFLLGFLFGLIPLTILAFLPSKTPVENVRIDYYQERVEINDGAKGNSTGVTRAAQGSDQMGLERGQSPSRDVGLSPSNQSPTKLVNPAEPSVGWLIVRSGPQINREFPLSKSEMKIGRDPGCQISIDNDTLSREHAKVLYRGNGTFEILDLGSRNGTKVNDRHIQKQTLYDNDIVQAGEIKFIFKSAK